MKLLRITSRRDMIIHLHLDPKENRYKQVGISKSKNRTFENYRPCINTFSKEKDEVN